MQLISSVAVVVVAGGNLAENLTPPQLLVEILSFRFKFGSKFSMAPLKVPLQPNRYLAYGANLSRSVLTARQLAHIHASGTPVRLRNYHLRFKHRGGFATIAPHHQEDDRSTLRNTPSLEGVLYAISPDDLNTLKKYETGYYTILIPTSELVHLADDDEGDATNSQDYVVTFASKWDVTLKYDVPPRRAYLNKILNGAEHFQLSHEYQNWLKSITTLRDDEPAPAAYSESPSATLAKAVVALALVMPMYITLVQ